MDFAARRQEASEQVRAKLREPLGRDQVLVYAWRCVIGRPLALEHWLFNLFPDTDPNDARDAVKKQGKAAWDPQGLGSAMDDKGWDALHAICKAKMPDLDRLAEHAGRNLRALVGAEVMAALLEAAGGLQSLSKLTQRSAMLLGADRAVFAGKRDKSILERHELATNDRALRVLSSRVVLAARLDAFKGQFKGESLRQEVLYAQ